MPGTLSSVLTANRLPLRLETKEKKAWMKTNYTLVHKTINEGMETLMQHTTVQG